MINIVYYSEVIDNWGREIASYDPKTICNVLKTSADWTDDMQFEDDCGRIYGIDDLIDKEVCVAEVKFIVKE